MRNMSDRLRGERGQVIVLSAVMIPVFLLVTALVLDVGNWYTHKRQLQNRADAAAFAAGTAYAQNWKACVYSGTDPARLAAKTAAINAIADAARQYAGDPDPTDYAGDTLPATPLENTQIANQSKIDVAINSTSYDDNTDYSDDYDGLPSTSLGNPCYLHTTGDSISAPGYWTDVRVKEGELPSLAGMIPSFFGKVDPLSQNGARARIEIRPAISGHRFLPLAIPDNVVTKVQVRYFDQCTGNEILKQDLAQLPDGDYDAYQSGGGGSLWAIPIPGSDPPVGDPSRSVNLPLTAYDPVQCPGLQYRPITEQVRIASAPDVDLDALSCSQLQAASFADCFTRLSQIRIWKDGNPDAEPVVKDAHVLGGCGTPGDGYFGVLALAATSCNYDVSVQVDWGDRDDGNKRVETNFTVKANGTTLAFAGRSGETVTYASSGGAFTGNAGPNIVNVSIAWYDDGGPTHIWQGKQCVDPPGSAKSPCIWATSTAEAHRTFIGSASTDTQSDPNATGAVESVHTSLAQIDATGALGASFDDWHPSSAGGSPCISPCAIYPTVGIRSALTSGTPTTLRTESSQGSQLVDCDPNVTQILTLFQYGCQPWFGPNSFKDLNWWTASKECPSKTLWFSYSASMPYTNSPGNPWRCVLNQGGSIVGQAGDWMAVATDNCNKVNPGGTQCQDFKKKTDATVHCGDYEAWALKGDSEDPRVVSLFVVPYQALKNVSGSGANSPIPVLRFASFYVMNWHGNTAGSNDPCPDLNFGSTPVNLPSGPEGKGTIMGVFDSTVSYETGPVDPNAICKEDDPTPCRAVLVR
jgi:hypothetical protein